MRNVKLYWLSCALICCTTTAVLADDAPTTAAATSLPADRPFYTLLNPAPSDQLRQMQTDRPNFTNAATTIDAGHLQTEFGAVDYSYYRNRYQGANLRADSISAAQFNFRFGVLDDLELNAVVNPFVFSRTDDYGSGTITRDSGMGVLTLGGKFNVYGNNVTEQVWASSLGIQPQFSLPLAGPNLSSGKFECSVAFPFEINLPAQFHFSYQPGVSHVRNTLNTGYVTGLQNAVSLDRVILNNLDIYLEYASNVTTQRHVEAVQIIDFGFVYQLTDNLTIDSGFNFGLNKATTNFEVTTGMSFRF